MELETTKTVLEGETGFYQELIGILKQHTKKSLPKDKLAQLKVELCRKHKMQKIPTDIQVMLHATAEDLEQIKPLLLTKPTRSLSGVAPVAVMTKPLACPHGKCTFCPGGPGSAFGDVPQSYTGKEPSTMRAIRAEYDAYLIVMNRLEQYVVTGHVPDKVELILQGGTFPAFPEEYQEEVITDCFQALNDFSTLFFPQRVLRTLDLKGFKAFFELPGDVEDEERTKRLHAKLLAIKKQQRTTLKEAQKTNETAKIRCVSLTVETKPDWAFFKHGNKMLEQGCTRVELGVESLYDDVLKVTHRGHTLEDTKRAIRELKDLGYKLNFHYMLGLPNTTKEMDQKALKELFENDAYKPDMMKIYPCMVLKGTPLYHIWKAGKYTPLTTAEAAELIVEAKAFIPEYCRIMRVQRDIPTYRTEAGVDRTNLRQYVEQLAKKKGVQCRCIRCREVGRVQKKDGKVIMGTILYNASYGKEFFIQAKDADNNVLYGFCRLRFPGQCLREEITPTSAIVRELKVFGEAAAIGEDTTQSKEKAQHKGLGTKLMQKAEEIAKEYNKNKIVVISAIGTREYYKKLGYHLEGPYMVKQID